MTCRSRVFGPHRFTSYVDWPHGCWGCPDFNQSHVSSFSFYRLRIWMRSTSIWANHCESTSRLPRMVLQIQAQLQERLTWNPCWKSHLDIAELWPWNAGCQMFLRLLPELWICLFWPSLISYLNHFPWQEPVQTMIPAGTDFLRPWVSSTRQLGGLPPVIRRVEFPKSPLSSLWQVPKAQRSCTSQEQAVGCHWS